MDYKELAEKIWNEHLDTYDHFDLVSYSGNDEEEAKTLALFNAIITFEYMLSMAHKEDESDTIMDAIKYLKSSEYYSVANEELFEQIKKEMLDWYGFDLNNKQIREYVFKTNISHFDTFEREEYVNKISFEITGMDYPCGGDLEGYKEKFFSLLKNNALKKGYKIDSSGFTS
jgi:cell division protein FtsI/penicillin-binding protein 2